MIIFWLAPTYKSIIRNIQAHQELKNIKNILRWINIDDIPYGLILDPYIEGEEWCDIPGYEGYFQGSSLGRLRSLDRFITCKNGATHFYKGRIIKQSCNKLGYFRAELNKNNTVKNGKFIS